jgi:ribosomal silencing factor RsfS
MTPAEHLWAYCQLILHGYSSKEAKEIMEEIKEKMKSDKSS